MAERLVLVLVLVLVPVLGPEVRREEPLAARRVAQLAMGRLAVRRAARREARQEARMAEPRRAARKVALVLAHPAAPAPPKRPYAALPLPTARLEAQMASRKVLRPPRGRKPRKRRSLGDRPTPLQNHLLNQQVMMRRLPKEPPRTAKATPPTTESARARLAQTRKPERRLPRWDQLGPSPVLEGLVAKC